VTREQSREAIFERPKPHSPEAERAILGAILLENILIFIARESLKVDDFYVISHRRIYQAMLALIEQKQPINPVLIAEELRRTGHLEPVGGVSFITNLTHGLPYSTNIEHYVKVLRGKTMLREMIGAHLSGLEDAFEEEDEPEIIFDRSEQRFRELAVAANSLRPAMRDYSDVGASVLKMFDAWSQGKVVAIPTQIPEVDSRLVNAGLASKDFIVVAGQTSFGKTAITLQIALNTARMGIPVLIFSLEMAAERLMIRNLASVSNVARKEISPRTFKKPDENAAVIQLVRDAVPTLQGLPIKVVDRARSLSRLVSIANDWKARVLGERLGLIIVDYMQLVQNPLNKRSREEEVTGISRELKGIAGEFNIPLIGVSQFNREPARSNRQPELKDLRESGAIEQDVDLALFIWSPNKVRDESVRAAKIFCAKQRDGQTGWEVDVDFDADHQWFKTPQMWRTEPEEETLDFNA
jgi:replicative DNA helicase